MSITPSQPQPRAAVQTWKLDAISLRIYDRRVALIYGAYDGSGNRIDERRFIIDDNSTPSLAAFLAACPAAPNLKQQSETFGATLDPDDLTGTVS